MSVNKTAQKPQQQIATLVTPPTDEPLPEVYGALYTILSDGALKRDLSTLPGNSNPGMIILKFNEQGEDKYLNISRNGYTTGIPQRLVEQVREYLKMFSILRLDFYPAEDRGLVSKDYPEEVALQIVQTISPSALPLFCAGETRFDYKTYLDEEETNEVSNLNVKNTY
jgi:hypothetical protein